MDQWPTFPWRTTLFRIWIFRIFFTANDMFAFIGSRQRKSRKPMNQGFRDLRMVPAAGVEPARVISPLDFESNTSANSITPALYRFL